MRGGLHKDHLHLLEDRGRLRGRAQGDQGPRRRRGRRSLPDWKALPQREGERH